MVEKLSDIYSHGSFVQIQEMQDLGDKLRLVVIAHRRIKITNQLFEDPVPEPKKKGTNLETLQMLNFVSIEARKYFFFCRNDNKIPNA